MGLFTLIKTILKNIKLDYNSKKCFQRGFEFFKKISLIK